MKEKDYLCPSCKSYLNAGGHIIFAVHIRKKQRGLVMLSPSVGNYDVLRHPALEIQAGDRVDFYCPVCHEPLTSIRNENLVEILMRDEDGSEHEVCFSRIAGEHSTYVLTGKDVEAFGSDAEHYLAELKR